MWLLKITTVLPAIIAESIAINPVIGLICVDRNNDNQDGSKVKNRNERNSIDHYLIGAVTKKSEHKKPIK